VASDCPFAEVKGGGDLFVGLSRCDEGEDLYLSCGESCRQRRGRREVADVTGIEDGSEPIEDRGRAGERACGTVLVAAVSARLAKQQADCRDLVGNLELLPPL
jgi:hypothetical protein